MCISENTNVHLYKIVPEKHSSFSECLYPHITLRLFSRSCMVYTYAVNMVVLEKYVKPLEFSIFLLKYYPKHNQRFTYFCHSQIDMCENQMMFDVIYAEI